MLLDAICRRRHLEQLGRHMRGTVGIGVRQDDDELVTTEPGDRVLVAHGSLQPPRHLQQQFVTNPVTQRVIDVLEAVEVEEHQGKRLPPAMRTREVMPDPLGEQAAVRQTGQRVVMGQPLDARLRLLVPSDVDECSEIVCRHAFALDTADRQPFRIHTAILAPVPHLALPASLRLDRQPHAAKEGGIVPPRGEHAGVAAKHVVGAVAGDAAERLVDHHHAAGSVGDGDPLAALFENLGRQIALGSGPLFGADVYDRPEVALELPILVAHDGDHQANGDATPVLANAAHLALVGLAAETRPDDQRIEAWLDADAERRAERDRGSRHLVGIMEQHRRRPAQQFFRAVAENRFGTRVEERDQPLRVGRNDAAGGAGKHQRLQRLALAQCQFRPPALRQQGGIFQRHRGARRQTLQHAGISGVETAGLVVNLEAAKEFAVAPDDRHVQQVVESDRLPDLGDDPGIVRGIVAEVGLTRLHDPPRDAVTGRETVVDRHPFAAPAVLAEHHLPVLQPCRGTAGGTDKSERGDDEFAQDHRHVEPAVDLLADARHQRELLAASQQSRLGPLARADVAHEDDEARLAAAIFRLARNRQLEPETALRQIQRDQVACRVAACMCLAQRVETDGGGGGIEYFRDPLADEVGRAGGQQSGAQRVRFMTGTVESKLEHRVGNGVQRRGELCRPLANDPPQGDHPDQEHAPHQRTDQQGIAQVACARRDEERSPHPLRPQRPLFRRSDGGETALQQRQAGGVSLLHRPVKIARIEGESPVEELLGVVAVKQVVCRWIVETEDTHPAGDRRLHQRLVAGKGLHVDDAGRRQVLGTGIAILDADPEALQRRRVGDATDAAVRVDRYLDRLVGWREIQAPLALRSPEGSIENLGLASSHSLLRGRPVARLQLNRDTGLAPPQPPEVDQKTGERAVGITKDVGWVVVVDQHPQCGRLPRTDIGIRHDVASGAAGSQEQTQQPAGAQVVHQGGSSSRASPSNDRHHTRGTTHAAGTSDRHRPALPAQPPIGRRSASASQPRMTR
ncbi:MAG: hypothetical protein AW07_01594 [Candidatus Accumulibacter sp. SK-11]|nr:MAG: hypothetical protein AW07_01594 [Candidatus Accumulibacter sp. SK-11]